MKQLRFIGRELELEKLAELHQRAKPTMAVIKGRRRVGKSTLVEHFANTQAEGRLWSFSGLAPSRDLKPGDQLINFAEKLAEQADEPVVSFTSWRSAFNTLSKHIKPNDVVLFDEISWMASDDRLFMPLLKVWWDQQSTPMLVVLCGSVSTWIEENIIKSTGLFGRISSTITLQPLSITDSHKLLKAKGFQGSVWEVYQLLSIFGGIPWYLEHISGNLNAYDNIFNLCFKRNGLLFDEFKKIFYDLFELRSPVYEAIMQALAHGPKTRKELRQALDLPPSGSLTRMLEHLATAGFVSKHALWSFKTKKPGRQSLYRLCDPWVRFYMKVVEPYRRQYPLAADSPSPPRPAAFETHLGLQLEKLLMQNRGLMLEKLGLSLEEIVAEGPYLQTATQSRKGCQIDYLIQTRTNNLIIFEFKYKVGELGFEVVSSMEEKIKALAIPRGFAPVPVLVYLGGLRAEIAIGDYFYRILDLHDLLDWPEYTTG